MHTNGTRAAGNRLLESLWSIRDSDVFGSSAVTSIRRHSSSGSIDGKELFTPTAWASETDSIHCDCDLSFGCRDGQFMF